VKDLEAKLFGEVVEPREPVNDPSRAYGLGRCRLLGRRANSQCCLHGALLVARTKGGNRRFRDRCGFAISIDRFGREGSERSVRVFRMFVSADAGEWWCEAPAANVGKIHTRSGEDEVKYCRKTLWLAWCCPVTACHSRPVRLTGNAPRCSDISEHLCRKTIHRSAYAMLL